MDLGGGYSHSPCLSAVVILIKSEEPTCFRPVKRKPHLLLNCCVPSPVNSFENRSCGCQPCIWCEEGRTRDLSATEVHISGNNTGNLLLCANQGLLYDSVMLGEKNMKVCCALPSARWSLSKSQLSPQKIPDCWASKT